MIDISKKIILNKRINLFIHKILIKLHNKLYFYISTLALISNNGLHPKHMILDYNQFFTDNISTDDNVIDIGCGIGHSTYDISKKSKNATGIDISQSNIKYAKEKFNNSNINYIIGDATSYPFKSRYDKIVLSNVLEHIKNRQQFLTKLHNLSNVILLRVPMLTRDWLTVYKKNMGLEYRLDNAHYIEYTLPILKDELDKSGWHIKNYSIQFGEFWGTIILKKNSK